MDQSMFAQHMFSKTLPLDRVHIEDDFWSEYIRLVRDVVIPYQWEVLNDRMPEAEPSHAVRNFKIAAGEEQGEFGGMVFQDSDLAKWLEAVGFLLQSKPDEDLEKVADEVISLIAKAQSPDGYLNTYFTLKEPGNRWTNLAECHELYCAGHMIEAAVAYYNATGKRVLLDVVCKLTDHIHDIFGNEEGKLKGYDGHQEIELALIKLYHVTLNEKYLKLSKFFLDQRGKKPHFYSEELKRRGGKAHFSQVDMTHNLSYSQAHLPVREQESAEGHAVRVVYMLCGMADVAAETGDEGLYQACLRMWRNIVSKRMYITGGIGSMAEGESLSLDYDLPNDTAYAETCASIGLIFFAQRMLRIRPNSEYADVLERALYNTVVSGMSRDGKQFFYVNPLEVHPEACGKNHIYDHVKPTRQAWFGCACCPPNIARLLASLGQYIYTTQDRTLYTHLYIGGKLEWELEGEKVQIKQKSQYARDGKVIIEISLKRSTSFSLALRIPNWCDGVKVMLNGVKISIGEEQTEDGYMRLHRTWDNGDRIDIEFSMPVLRMKGHPSIRHTAGKVAIQRGPFIYCLEEADNGPHLHQLVLPRDSDLKTSFNQKLLGGMQIVTAAAQRVKATDWQDDLYREDAKSNWTLEEVELTFVPYFAWANRGVGEMSVWIKDA